MSCLAHRRFRRVHALLLCTLWLVGFEVGPGLHVALHSEIGHHHHGPVAAAHEHAEPHAGDHEIPAADDDGHGHAHKAQQASHHGHESERHEAHEPSHHGHDDAHHAHGASDRHAAPEPASQTSDEAERPALDSDRDDETAVARLAQDLDHGAHALAHRGIAASPTPPAWPPVAVAPWVYLSRASFALDPIRSRGPQRARARGPPDLS